MHRRAHTCAPVESGRLGNRNAPMPVARVRVAVGPWPARRRPQGEAHRTVRAIAAVPLWVCRYFTWESFGENRKGNGLGLRLPQELPEHWTNTKKLAIQVKQNVAPLQANEVNILRRKCQQFEVLRPGPGRGLRGGVGRRGAGRGQQSGTAV